VRIACQECSHQVRSGKITTITGARYKSPPELLAGADSGRKFEKGESDLVYL
jgi:hypothetical protein